MGIYRTYFDKNTVIISNSKLNTARNPISQLFYGKNNWGTNEYSRLLIHFNVSNIQSLVNDKTIMGETKHVLKMKNTSFFDKELVGSDFGSQKRAYSFDLVIFKINEYWDEGAGYDVVPDVFQTPNNNTYILGPANWKNRTTTELWTTPGIVDYETVIPEIITRQHFEFGNEDIELDITTEINSLLTGDTNNGYCICFDHNCEILTGTTQQQYTGFYSRHTNTYYEPFLETTWNDLIEDDRGYFFMGRTNRIFYYATIDGQPINLDTLPTVTILDENNTVISSGTSSQLSKGVYYYDFSVPENENLDTFQITDKWVVSYNGRSKNVTGKITLLNDDSFLPSPSLCNNF